jgi:hypothetical protein
VWRNTQLTSAEQTGFRYFKLSKADVFINPDCHFLIFPQSFFDKPTAFNSDSQAGRPVLQVLVHAFNSKPITNYVRYSAAGLADIITSTP